jgi:adenine-specific DNA-methyltransferase
MCASGEVVIDGARAGRAAELGLTAAELLKLSPPGSRHLRGLAFGAAAHNELGRQASTLLFRPNVEPFPAGRAYIKAGETANVHTAYKGRVRAPWWRVPLVPPADLLLTYMNGRDHVTELLPPNPGRFMDND